MTFTDFLYEIVMTTQGKRYLQMTPVEKLAQTMVDDPFWPRLKVLSDYETYFRARGWSADLKTLRRAWALYQGKPQP